MINISFVLDNISTVLSVFDRIQIRRYTGTGLPSIPVSLVDYTTISGVDEVSNISPTSELILDSRYNQYYFTDPDGEAEDWYISRYYNSSNASSTAWTDPILGESQDLFYNPAYPPEIEYGTADQLIIDRIRLLIGDPIGLRREFGEEAESSIMPDGKTYQLDESGWPAFINMNGIQYVETANPSINGYRFLKFNEFIDTPVTVISGSRMYQQGVDIWYYTHRFSDREIMEAYDSTPPPAGLTTVTANSEAYMLSCSYDLLSSETHLAIEEDGAVIVDEGTKYDPNPSMKLRAEMLDKLKKRLDDLVKSLLLTGVVGVRVD